MNTKLKEEFWEMIEKAESTTLGEANEGAMHTYVDWDMVWNWIEQHFISTKSYPSDYINKNRKKVI